MTYAVIFKFNPNHDEAGRFAQRSATTFFSPNVGEGHTVYAGAGRLRSYEQRKYRGVSDRVDKMLGLAPSATGAVGAWSDGGENSIVSQYAGSDFEAVKAAVAMKGLLAQQKGVIAYKAATGGPSRMHTISRISVRDPSDLSAALVDIGIPFHTLVRNGKGFDVMVFEEEKDPSMASKVLTFAKRLRGTARHTTGNGQLIGSWDNRAEGVKEYTKVIDRYLARKPHQRREWDAMVKAHNFRAVKMALLSGI